MVETLELYQHYDHFESRVPVAIGAVDNLGDTALKGFLQVLGPEQAEIQTQRSGVATRKILSSEIVIEPVFVPETIDFDTHSPEFYTERVVFTTN